MNHEFFHVITFSSFRCCFCYFYAFFVPLVVMEIFHIFLSFFSTVKMNWQQKRINSNELFVFFFAFFARFFFLFSMNENIITAMGCDKAQRYRVKTSQLSRMQAKKLLFIRWRSLTSFTWTLGGLCLCLSICVCVSVCVYARCWPIFMRICRTYIFYLSQHDTEKKREWKQWKKKITVGGFLISLILFSKHKRDRENKNNNKTKNNFSVLFPIHMWITCTTVCFVLTIWKCVLKRTLFLWTFRRMKCLTEKSFLWYLWCE